MRRARSIAPLLLVLLAGSALGQGPADKDELRAALRTVEGRVVVLGKSVGEGSLPLVSVTLENEGAPGDTVDILLAPQKALEAAGFDVSPGDRLRARVFVAEGGPAPAHTVENLSRGSEVRLRTLHRVPLWDDRGAWQGGASRRRHRHGRSGL